MSKDALRAENAYGTLVARSAMSNIYVSRCPKTPWVASDDVSVTAVCSPSSLSLQYNVTGLLSKSFQDLVVWVSLDSAGDNQVRGEQRNIAVLERWGQKTK